MNSKNNTGNYVQLKYEVTMNENYETQYLHIIKQKYSNSTPFSIFVKIITYA